MITGISQGICTL